MNGQRHFIGIGVGKYDDKTLNLKKAHKDVQQVKRWFVEKCGLPHQVAQTALERSPTRVEIEEGLRAFMKDRSEDDVVVIWFACHGESYGRTEYLFGRDTPREQLAGKAVAAKTIGDILGDSRAQNVLIVIDACVAGDFA